MSFKRLTSPEVNDQQLDAPVSERKWRKLGGYLLGGGSLLGLVGARAVLRPAYQNDDNYEDVRQETRTDKAKRVAAFMGGFVLFDAGVILAGVSIFGPALPVVSRIMTGAIGAAGINFGRKIIRGSYDPELFSSEPYQAPISGFAKFRDNLSSNLSTGFATGKERAEQRTAERDRRTHSRSAQRDLSNLYLGEKMDELRAQYMTPGATDRTAYMAGFKQLLADYEQASMALYDSSRTSYTPQTVAVI